MKMNRKTNARSGSDNSKVADKVHRPASKPNGKDAESYRTLFYAVQEGFYWAEVICDTSGEPVDFRYLDINPAMERFLGKGRDELIGHTALEVFPALDTDAMKKLCRVALTGEPIHLDGFSRLLNRWYRVQVFSPQQGQFAGIVSDIGERKQAEEALRRSEERLSATYAHAPIGIVECSPEGKYINVNEEFCRITGYKKEELLTLDIKDLTHEDDYSMDIILHQQLVTGKIPSYQIEKQYVHKDGGVVWVELTRNVVRDSNGKALAFGDVIAVKINITSFTERG